MICKELGKDLSIPAASFGERHFFADLNNGFGQHRWLCNATCHNVIRSKRADPAAPNITVALIISARGENHMRNHSVLPLTPKQTKDFHFCSLNVNMPPAEGYKTTVPEPLVWIEAMRRNSVQSSVILFEDAFGLLKKIV